MSLADRILGVMADVGSVSKDGKNEFHQYRYVSSEHLRSRVQKSCVKHGLILRLTYPEIAGVSATSATVMCRCEASEDGVTWVTLGEGWGSGNDKGDKGPMKANSAAAKYALANAFCIALGDDPEADAATDRNADQEAHVKDELLAEERQWWNEVEAMLNDCDSRKALDQWAFHHAAQVTSLRHANVKGLAWRRIKKAADSFGIANVREWFAEMTQASQDAAQ